MSRALVVAMAELRASAHVQAAACALLADLSAAGHKGTVGAADGLDAAADAMVAHPTDRAVQAAGFALIVSLPPPLRPPASSASLSGKASSPLRRRSSSAAGRRRSSADSGGGGGGDPAALVPKSMSAAVRAMGALQGDLQVQQQGIALLLVCASRDQREVGSHGGGVAALVSAWRSCAKLAPRDWKVQVDACNALLLFTRGKGKAAEETSRLAEQAGVADVVKDTLETFPNNETVQAAVGKLRKRLSGNCVIS